MIFLTGDLHSSIDRLTNDKRLKNLTKDDYVIVTGDFGLSKKYHSQLINILNNQPFTTLYVDGNHEFFNELKTLPVREWKGGKVQYLASSIIHLMRGQVYNIDGKKFFTFGGAESIDKMFQQSKGTWFKEELPSKKEIDEGFINLANNKHEVDYIITHCFTAKAERKLFRTAYANKLTDFLEYVYQSVKFKKWFTGHYHMDCPIAENVECLYENIIELE